MRTPIRYRVTNLTRKTILGEKIHRADPFAARFKGLLGKRSLASGEGLIISPCNSVHTFFMAIPIDVIFLDAENRVLHIDGSLAPWRMSRLHLSATSVIELPAQMARATATDLNDQLRIEPSTLLANEI